MMTSNILSFPETVEFDDLLTRIKNNKATVGIIGLGYVGLPLAYAFNKPKVNVIGFDIDHQKITSLKSGKSYIKSIAHQSIVDLNDSGCFTPTDDVEMLKQADVIIMCVPTPLSKNREPDMSYVEKTSSMIATVLRKGQLVILESTTYPGTTTDLIKPILEKTGLTFGHDFYLSYSPEREDPGNPTFCTSSIPKVVGADDEKSLALSVALYEKIVPHVVPVSTSATAEAVKLTENIFRCVNIALVNELKTVFSKMNIDVWEVIEAAKTKPFGYMPFYPGPGLGGHCIPIDPFYLTWKAREYNLSTKFIELAGEINTTMPNYVIQMLYEALDARFGKGLNKTNILMLGLAYKKNVDDIRESPSLVLFESLMQRGASVSYFDPFIPEVLPMREHPSLVGKKSVQLNEKTISQADVVLICTDHDDVDYEFVAKHAKLIVDTRNACKNLESYADKIVKA